MDALLLSRMQFAANITFHILFPAITIALGWFLLVMRWRWTATRDRRWLSAYRFWVKIFALSFALGVVSGLVMSFQFGTNWPGFLERAGNIAGPLLGYEVLTAFFLEATFLGVMLFGHDRVSERVHLLATLMVALGTTASAFWILSLNSWMQTPAGYEIIDGRFHATDWLAVLFNPSFPYRLTHMLLASVLTVSFLMAGIGAWQTVRRTAHSSTPLMMRIGLTAAAITIPVQILVGDLHGLNTLEHQPQKVAAMEALWQTQTRAPLVLFAIPDGEARENRFEIAIPGAASLILRHDIDGEVQGLDDFPDAHPPVAPVFFAFRIMVGTGVLMLLVSWVALYRLRRAGWEPARLPAPLLWTMVGMTFSGWLATVAGWYVTEIGRQPFLVHGLMRTAEAATTVPARWIAVSFAAYLTVYLALIVAYVTVLRHLAEQPEHRAADALEPPVSPEALRP